jgi:hypothetical protein
MARKTELDLEIAEMLEFYQAAATRSDSHVADACFDAHSGPSALPNSVFSAHASARPDRTADRRHQR